jgi:hypothetical protein
MFVVLLLNGKEWCELWSKGGRTTTKDCVNLKLSTLAGFELFFLHCIDGIQNG